METKEQSTDSILQDLKRNTNVMEQAFKDLVELLFSEDKLLMIARLHGDMAQNILKNLIVEDFYQNYYGYLKVNVHFKELPEYPFYKKIIDPPNLKYKDGLLTKYHTLIDNLMKISISDKGEGRKEILEILKKGAEEIQKEKQLSNFMGKLG